MFIYNGQLFSQIDEIAMGNPIGLTFANWFIEMIEKKIFDQHLSLHLFIIFCTLCGRCVRDL